MLARFLFSSVAEDKAQQKRDKLLKARMSTANPVFDPNLDLARTSSTYEDITGHNKEATGPIEVIVPMAAMLGGASVGTTLHDKLRNRVKTLNIDEEIEELANELDALNYKRLMLARGQRVGKTVPKVDYTPEGSAGPSVMDKFAQDDSEQGGPWQWAVRAARSAAGAFDTMMKPLRGSEVKGDVKGKGGEAAGWTDSIYALVSLLMLSTGVTSAVLTKRYFDEIDPSRIEKANLNTALENLAKQEQQKVSIRPTPLAPELRQAMDTHLKGQPAAPKLPEPEYLPQDTTDTTFKI